MLRVARQKVNSMNFKLEEAKLTEQKLNRYQRKYVEQEQEIKELKEMRKNVHDLQFKDVEIQVDHEDPEDAKILQMELKKAQLENERLNILDRANKEQIAQIQMV